MTSSSQKFQDHGGLHPPRDKLHVTILASEWRSTKGGVSTISRELAIELAKFPEVKITYFVPQCSDEDKRTALSHHIEIVEATRLCGYDELEWLSFPPDVLQIDVIVGHGVKLGHQAQVIRMSHKCKWIQVVHTDPEELGMYKSYQNPISTGEKKHKVEVELCEKADFVVGVGPKLCEAFRRYLCWCKKDETILDLTPGVFDEFRKVKHASKERERCGILVFGRGDAEDFQLKGFDVASKAVAELSDAHLVFVGAPEGKHEDIAKRLLECGLPAHRLTVRSFLQGRKDLERLFCEVDLVLMPSRTEGFGLTGLEALSAGLPVLVSKNSGFGEALHKVPFGSACVIDSEDPLVWAEAIKEVWKKDRETRLQEAELLRSSYRKRYSWAKQTKDLVKKMVNIVNQDPEPTARSVSFATRSDSLGLGATQYSSLDTNYTRSHDAAMSSPETKRESLQDKVGSASKHRSRATVPRHRVSSLGEDSDVSDDLEHGLGNHTATQPRLRTQSSESSTSSVVSWDHDYGTDAAASQSRASAYRPDSSLCQQGDRRKRRPHSYHGGMGSVNDVHGSKDLYTPSYNVRSSPYDVGHHSTSSSSYSTKSLTTTPDHSAATASYTGTKQFTKPFAPRSISEIQVGMTVLVARPREGTGRGVVKYIGPLPGRKDVYIGVELGPGQEGKHDGSVDGERLFYCKPNRGIFVTFNKVVMYYE